MFHQNYTRGKPRSSKGYGRSARITFPRDTSQSAHLQQDSSYENISGYSPLFLAVHRGNLELAHSLLRKNSLNEKIFGKFLIHVAAARGHEQMICLLCSRNASVRLGDSDGNTPLHLAIKGNHTDVVNLLANKVTAKITNRYKQTPLHFAVVRNDISFVKILLKNGAKANVQDDKGETPLHVAVQKKNTNLKIISLLLSNGAKVNVHCHDEVTPLFIAVSLENNEVIKLLIKHGASIDLANKNGISSLVLGVQKNNAEIVKHLLASDSKDPLEEMDKMTPLHYAAQSGNYEIVKLLMTNGYDKVNAKNENFETPLYYAAINGHLKLLKYLLENGAEIELATSDKESLLHKCVIINRKDILKILIDNGAKIDIKNWQAETPLHFSISNNRVNIFNYLVEHGANIHAKTLSGETPLQLAVKAGSDAIVEELLKWGVKIDSLVNEYNSGLLFAIKSRMKKIVQLLLTVEDKEKFFTCQSQLLNKENLLHIAVKNEDDDILKMLLDAGCPCDVDGSGKNALHVAATFGHTKAVKTLIEAGVDINSKTKFSETPLHLAAASGRPSVVRYLIDAGAQTKFLGTSVDSGIKLTLSRFSRLSSFITDSISSNALNLHTPLDYTLNRKRHEDIKQKRSYHSRNRLEYVRSNPDWHITPFMFEKYLEVTELLLMKTDPDEMSLLFTRSLKYASQIRVLNENKKRNVSKSTSNETSSMETDVRKLKSNETSLEFRPEIIRCILNYSSEMLVMSNFREILKVATEVKLLQLIDIFLEYDIKRQCFDFHINCMISDLKIVLALIDHIYDIDQLLILLYHTNVQREVNRFLLKTGEVIDLTEEFHQGILFPEMLLRMDCKLELSRSTFMDVLKLLVARLVQTRSMPKYSSIPRSRELKILKNYNLSDWYSQCEVQIMSMRESKVHHEFDVTYYDVLTKPVNKLANYVERKDFLKSLEYSYQKFPAYSKFLERSVCKGMQRKDAINPAIDCFFNIISKNCKIKLPISVIDAIFEYLTVIDLRKLSAVRNPAREHIKPVNSFDNFVPRNKKFKRF